MKMPGCIISLVHRIEGTNEIKRNKPSQEAVAE